jgi:L-ascorbate metabolism protein UlaG (beta-lactamase superfamily)
MKRRILLALGLTAAIAPLDLLGAAAQAQTTKARPKAGKALNIRWLGHTCFLFSSPEATILVNPFKPSGCTAGYRKPAVGSDLVLLSSRLLDEGSLEVVPGNPKVLFEPGIYNVDSLKFQGVRTFHDQKQGLRYGVNVAWSWQQAGIKVVHLGGIASPLTAEQKILLGTPDILLLPVGGGEKSYSPEAAKQAVSDLNPRIVIPTLFRTKAADETCTLVGMEDFVKSFPAGDVQIYGSDQASFVASNIPKQGTVVRAFTYRGYGSDTKEAPKKKDSRKPKN